jgi:hypothetical protein
MGNDIDLPSIFLFNKQNGKFSITTKDPIDLGVYKLGLKIYYNELPSYKVRCELPVKVSYNPIFEGDFIAD